MELGCAPIALALGVKSNGHPIQPLNLKVTIATNHKIMLMVAQLDTHNAKGRFIKIKATIRIS